MSFDGEPSRTPDQRLDASQGGLHAQNPVPPADAVPLAAAT
jgi:hypothetical protein